MNAYVESSVLLRIVLRQPLALPEWNSIVTGVTSVLSEVECLRTLDRIRLRATLTDQDLAGRRNSVYRLLQNMEVVEVSRSILARASNPFATSIGTLDAIHLATALHWKDTQNRELTMATHDAALARTARAHGMPVIGV